MKKIYLALCNGKIDKCILNNFYMTKLSYAPHGEERDAEGLKIWWCSYQDKVFSRNKLFFFCFYPAKSGGAPWSHKFLITSFEIS